MRKLFSVAACAAAATALGSSAQAHHSGAMFDRTKQVTIQGTLKEVQWINPHAWIEATGSPDGRGQPVQWSFELGGGVGNLRGMGLTRSNPAVGDRVTIYGYPLKDGRPGASFIRMVMADGRVFGAPLPGQTQGPPAQITPAR